jgi:hypothetical protein
LIMKACAKKSIRCEHVNKVANIKGLMKNIVMKIKGTSVFRYFRITRDPDHRVCMFTKISSQDINWLGSGGGHHPVYLLPDNLSTSILKEAPPWVFSFTMNSKLKYWKKKVRKCKGLMSDEEIKDVEQLYDDCLHNREMKFHWKNNGLFSFENQNLNSNTIIPSQINQEISQITDDLFELNPGQDSYSNPRRTKETRNSTPTIPTSEEEEVEEDEEDEQDEEDEEEQESNDDDSQSSSKDQPKIKKPRLSTGIILSNSRAKNLSKKIGEMGVFELVYNNSSQILRTRQTDFWIGKITGVNTSENPMYQVLWFEKFNLTPKGKKANDRSIYRPAFKSGKYWIEWIESTRLIVTFKSLLGDGLIPPTVMNQIRRQLPLIKC